MFVGKSVLAALSLSKCRTPVAGVLVTQARESGLAVLAPCCLAGEPDVEAATSEPQEDCSCGLVEKLLAAGGLLLASASSLLPSASSSLLAGTSGVLVEELFVLVEELSVAGSLLLASASSSLLLANVSSSLLASTSGLRVEERLAAGILLLASASSLLNEECLVLVRP